MNIPTITGYQCETSIGLFCIQLLNDSLYHVIHDGQDYGDYPTAARALDALVNDNIHWHSVGTGVAAVGIPSNLRDWGAVLGGGNV